MSEETPALAAQRIAEAEKLRHETEKLRHEAERERSIAAASHIALEREQLAHSYEKATDYACRVYRLSGAISPNSTQSCISIMTAWSRMYPGEPMELVINSPGGSVTDGLALYDELQRLLSPVPGWDHAGIADVLGDLAALGYDAEWTCLSAAEVGAPHLRERIFVVATLADTGRLGLRREHGDDAGTQGAGESEASQRQRLRTDAGARGEAVANANGTGQQGRHRELRPRGWGEPADAHGRIAQPRVGDDPDGPTARMDRRAFSGWPAGRGEPQHEWEPPRVARGVVNRSHRLRALGNAVVPAVGEVIGRYILETLW